MLQQKLLVRDMSILKLVHMLLNLKPTLLTQKLRRRDYKQPMRRKHSYLQNILIKIGQVPDLPQKNATVNHAHSFNSRDLILRRVKVKMKMTQLKFKLKENGNLISVMSKSTDTPTRMPGRRMAYLMIRLPISKMFINLYMIISTQI